MWHSPLCTGGPLSWPGACGTPAPRCSMGSSRWRGPWSSSTSWGIPAGGLRHPGALVLRGPPAGGSRPVACGTPALDGQQPVAAPQELVHQLGDPGRWPAAPRRSMGSSRWRRPRSSSTSRGIPAGGLRHPGSRASEGPDLAQLSGIATQGTVVLLGLLPVHILICFVRCLPVSRS